MKHKLRDVTHEFARGEASLETLRAAARREPVDRRLADDLLKLIATWEKSPWPNSAWSRNELRDQAKLLVPPIPEAPKVKEDATRSMYGPGLRSRGLPH